MAGFFSVSVGYIDLPTLYQLNFTLMHVCKWSLADVERMYPYEREIYTGLLAKHISEQAKEQ